MAKQTRQGMYQKGISALGSMNYILSVEKGIQQSQREISEFYQSMEKKGYSLWMSSDGTHYYEKDGKESQRWKSEYDFIFELTLLARDMD